MHALSHVLKCDGMSGIYLQPVDLVANQPSEQTVSNEIPTDYLKSLINSEEYSNFISDSQRRNAQRSSVSDSSASNRKKRKRKLTPSS